MEIFAEDAQRSPLPRLRITHNPADYISLKDEGRGGRIRGQNPGSGFLQGGNAESQESDPKLRATTV